MWPGTQIVNPWLCESFIFNIRGKASFEWLYYSVLLTNLRMSKQTITGRTSFFPYLSAPVPAPFLVSSTCFLYYKILCNVANVFSLFSTSHSLPMFSVPLSFSFLTPHSEFSKSYFNFWRETRQPFSLCWTVSTGCDNSDRDKQLKQVFKNAQSVKKSW